MKLFWKRKKTIERGNRIPVTNTVPRANNQLYRSSKQLYMEDINYNLQMLRKRLPDTNLTFEYFTIGSRSNTKVVIAYLKDLANPGIVNEIKERLINIKAEIIPDSSYIERNIEDSNWSPFPQVEIISKVDITLSVLTQGRVAIFVDGCPSVIAVPVTFFDLMDTPDDAYRRWFFASSFFRIARYISFIIATLLPGFYIALTSFLPELIPTVLTFNIAASREGVPFPIYLEAFILMGIAELVRMVILRMPNIIGQVISLFAGITLVMTTLVANIIGAPIIIIVGITIIASFAVPSFDLRSSIRIIQFFIMVFSTIFGLFGLAIGFFYIAIHLATLKSFGIPYMAPFGPTELSGWGHTILRESPVKMAQDQTYKPQKNKS
ncbi:MAG: spore germination protein [Bacillota bacterium]